MRFNKERTFMHKTKILRYIVILFLCLSFAGCATLQKKFVRKKKEEEKPAPVITMYDYSKDLRTDELYKKHFLFWKTWQLELIGRMDATYKKRNDCYDHIIANLMEMQRYLRSMGRYCLRLPPPMSFRGAERRGICWLCG